MKTAIRKAIEKITGNRNFYHVFIDARANGTYRMKFVTDTKLTKSQAAKVLQLPHVTAYGWAGSTNRFSSYYDGFTVFTDRKPSTIKIK